MILNFKKKNTLLRVAFCFLLAPLQNVYSQGCSDAGFCTIGANSASQADSTETDNQNAIKAGISYGQADNEITIMGSYLQYSRKVSDKISLETRLTSLSQNGNGIKTSGLSDVFISSTYSFNKKSNLTIAGKFPLNNGNKKRNGNALPMDYQSSLGTVDLILGFSYEINKFKFSVGFQQPVTQNKNEFIAYRYPYNLFSYNFSSTNKYIRSGDILFRATYSYRVTEKMILTAGILPIYHIENDKFTDTTGARQTLTGSQGLTLNGNLILSYALKKFKKLELVFGSPVISRKVRPDGLTRKFLATIEYSIQF